ncbi:FecR family protein [Bacteroides sp.]|uniref:FecR family protein n=1 Tax=Bacteroides sp. TaxID=29523 RepID=UPI003AB7D047
MEKQKKNIELLERLLERTATAKDKVDLAQWLKEPDAQSEVDAYLKYKWLAAKEREETFAAQQRIFDDIKTMIQGNDRSLQMVQKKKPRILRYWTSIAAVFVACIAIGYLLYPVMTSEDNMNQFVTKVNNGQKASITLPDGTLVWLNSDTQIMYGTDYGKKSRVVTLNGEAYFEVAHDKDKKFIVRAEDMNIEVLGTVFNVKAYKESSTIVATLKEGKIKAFCNSNDQEVIVYPNEEIVYNRSDKTFNKCKPKDPSYAYMWKNDELGFNNERLESIALLLEKMYNIKVVFKTEVIKDLRFSGIIKNNSLDNILEIIHLTSSVNYKLINDTITLDYQQKN